MPHDLTADLRHHFASSLELADLVADRIYPDVIPQQTARPAIAIEIQQDNEQPLAAGRSALRMARVGAVIQASTREMCRAVARVFDDEDLMNGYRGLIGATQGTYLRGTRRVGAPAALVPPGAGSDRWEHRITVTWEIPYSRQ